MPSHLKDLVRARMEKTGESYQRALEHVRAQEERAPSGPEHSPGRRELTVEDTAFSIAVVREEERHKPEGERLFSDPYAALFARGGAHAAEATQRFLELPFFRDGVRLRTRFIDDFVRESLAAGLTQVVILGAGFDMRGLRLPEIAKTGARVYEIDTPAQLERKRAMLTAGGVRIPSRIAYVPFDLSAHDLDFESDLTAALEAKGFRRGGGALFIWEGVIGYIDDAMMDRSLRFMVHAGGPSTRLVFTHAEGTFDPDNAATRTQRLGFSTCEEFGSDAIWRRYLPGEPHPNAWVIKLGTAIV